MSIRMTQRIAALGLVAMSLGGVALTTAPAAQAAVSSTVTSDSTTIGYTMTAVSSSAFRITATGMPVGGKTKVLITRQTSLQTTTKSSSATYSTTRANGWIKAQMLVYDAAGNLLSISPELHPGDGTVTVTPKVVTPPATPRTADSATLGAMLQGQAEGLAAGVADLTKVQTAVMQTRADSVALVKAAKAKNPKLKVYAYVNASAVSKDAVTPGFQPSIVSALDYAKTDAWHLKVAGTKTDVTWPAPYDYLKPIDVSNPAVQADAAARAKALLADGTFDGIFLDDVNFDETGHGSQVGSFYGGLNREDAMVSLVKSYAAAVHSVGKKVAINYQQRWPYSEDGVKKFAPYVDNVLLEHFAVEGDGEKKTASPVQYQLRDDAGNLRFNDDGSPMMSVDYNLTNQWNDGDWGWKLREMKNIQDAGAGVWTTTYIDHSDTAAQQYARAMFLMGWDGKSDSASMPGIPKSAETSTFWNDEASLDPGYPVDEMRELQKGVYVRGFSKYGLIVNASDHDQVVNTTWQGQVTLKPGQVFKD